MQFSIPLQRQDLLASSGPGQYRVENEYTVRELKTKLRDCHAKAQRCGSDFLGDGDGFDVIYSVLSNFHKEIPAEYKHKAFETLVFAATDFIRIADSFLCSAESSNNEEKKTYATKMKMVFYLLCQIVEMFEGEAMQSDSAAMAVGGGKGKRGGGGGKKAAAPRFEDEDDDLTSGSWDGKRQEAVTLMFRLANLNLNALFTPPLVEEEFVNLLGNCMFKLLENPSIALQRARDVRTSVLQVLGTINAKYNYSLSFRLKIVQSLKHFEHLVTPCGEAIELSTTSFGCKNMVMEIVRELSRLDSRELNRDTSGTRAYSLFLVELAERLPEQIQPSLSLLLHHLDGESYMLRKSILFVFTEIVLKLYSNPETAKDAAAKEARDQYLDYLEDHIHDVHAFVRSGVLQAWSKMCVAKAIPLTRQYRLLKLVVGRLQDRSSNVRKQAVQLLTALLQCNPYNASLPVEELKERYEKEKEKLAAMKPDDADDEKAQEKERLKSWPAIQKGLSDYLDDDAAAKEDDDANTDKLWENASPGEVHERIRQHLAKKKFGPAVTLFSAALAEFPIFKNLEAISREDQDGDDDDDEIDPIVAQLKTIFFLPLPAQSPPAELSQGNDAADATVNEEATKQAFLVSYLKDSVDFANMLNEALPVVCMLLGSKQITDVLEAIQFFVSAFEFGVLNAMLGVRQMLSLIFSREQTVQNAVVAAYKRLYIDPADDSAAAGNNAVQMVRNLTALICGATIGDLAGLEELIGMLVKSKDIDKNCFQVMWQYFTKVMPDTTDEQSQAALVLLGMVASSEPSIVISNVNVLVEHGLGQRGADNFRLVHDTCAALLKIATASKTSTNDPEPPFKFAADHELFARLETLLVEGMEKLDDDQYIPMTQQAIAVIYQLSELPDKRAADLCKKLIAKFGNKKGNKEEEEEEADEDNMEVDNNLTKMNQDHLRRLVFLVGHVAVCHLRYLDVSVFNELKRRNTLREVKKEKEKNEKAAAAAAAKKSSRRKSNVRGSASASILETPRGGSTGGGGNKEEDEDMGVVGAEADDAEAEFIRSVCEKEVVTGSDNFLSAFAPVIVEVCGNPAKYPDPKLRAAATLSLAKYMLVSSEFCENNLQLLFTILEKSGEAVIRANTIIAAGDLSFRFPNTVEPWTPRMYACLRDGSSLVRSNTLTVLTHLILNDMIKVRGQISDMAMCIVDDMAKISNLAKLFFTELARKGNALYNVMPDIISGLSDPEIGAEEDKFREIMKYIISLIEKDKHLESLVEKLCLRFRVTKTQRQWRDLSFCLSIFSYSEKAVKKLVENFECFADKLHEDSVYEAFNTIMSTAKKAVKTDTRLAVEELNEKIEAARAKGVEDDTSAKKAVAAAKKAKKGQQQPAKTPSRRGKAKKAAFVEESSDEEEEEEEEEDGENEAAVQKENQSDNQSKRPASSSPPVRSASKRRHNDKTDKEGFAVPKTPSAAAKTVPVAAAATPSSSARPKRSTRNRK